MTTLTASQARADLYRLMDKVAAAHEPVQITGKKTDSVLLSGEDWRSIQETLYLVSQPGLRESIRRGMKTPLSRTSRKLNW